LPNTDINSGEHIRAEVWSRILSLLLSAGLSSVAVDTWFNDCRLVDLTANEAYIHTPSAYKRDIIESKFTLPIRDALRQLLPGEFDVFILDDEGLHAHNLTAAEKQAEDEFHTFERFVVGSSNKFAHAAALAVATEKAGNDYNPLFIYGPSGVGKTHLLRAIRNTLRAAHPDYNIVYVRGDDFTNQLIHSLQAGKNVEFRDKYRNAHVFLMDDVQFIAGKVSTQEEFFNTFDTLHMAGRQIVLTSDRPPKEIATLENRLRTRFEASGLMADIQPPDFETRMAIILNKARELGFSLPDDVALYIAENMSANVRQLEGAVRKIRAYAEFYGVDSLTVAEVSMQIKDLLRDNEKKITADIIITETARYFQLLPADLKGQSRTRATVQARQLSWYLMRTLTPLSLKEIGKFFGDRDHSTILNGVRNVEKDVKIGGESTLSVRDISSNIQTIAESG
jgi:chromosomal replication initiator protein